jgi:tRNA threonylcarbamoyladenosine biosynthesis protein TsaB
MSLILCIETGTDTCSVGLARDGRLVALRESSEERDHARRVAVYTDEILHEAGVDAEQITAVAVSKGPGSYTGLRIGVSFAKGLCYGLGIPLIGVGSLDSLARSAIEKHEAGAIEAADWDSAVLVPMIDARRMEVFGQAFDTAGRPLSDAGAWIIDENSLPEFRDGRKVLIFGSGAEKCRQMLPWAQFVDIAPSARGMVGLATAAFEDESFEDTAYFEPFYLKDFVVTASKKKLF